MRRVWPAVFGVALGLAAGHAIAGLDVPPAPVEPQDLSGYALKAQMPAACDAVPVSDTLNGSTGSAGCFVPRDAARPTVVQAANVSTDSNGTWSVTWARPFASSQPVVNPLPVNAGSLPILCNVSARSGTAASGRCWQSTSTTLPGTLATLVGLVVSPFAAPASNAAVMVIAREPTQ